MDCSFLNFKCESVAHNFNFLTQSPFIIVEIKVVDVYHLSPVDSDLWDINELRKSLQSVFLHCGIF